MKYLIILTTFSSIFASLLVFVQQRGFRKLSFGKSALPLLLSVTAIFKQLRGRKGILRRVQFYSLTSGLLAFVLLFQTVAPPIMATTILRVNTPRSTGVTGATGNHSVNSAAPSKSIPGNSATVQQVVPQELDVEAATVRHAPNINGRVEGSLRQLTGESLTMNSGAVITSALLVPGTPQVQINGQPNFGGTVQGGGSSQPTNFQVMLNGGSTLGRLVNRVDPVQLPTVSTPPNSNGTRSVVITAAGQSYGDPATLRDLTLNSSVGNVAVPPGTYRNFSANNSSGFILGVSGSTQPTVYNFSTLTLNSVSTLSFAGPVILTVTNSLSVNGTVGSATSPQLLTLKISSGGLTLNSGSSLYGVVQAPSGTVMINGNTLLQGSVACDRLTVNSGGILKGTAGTLASLTPTSALQGQTLQVTLNGFNTHWLNGQTMVSFADGIAVGGAAQGAFGSVQVIDSVTAIATIVISSTATIGTRTVQVRTPVPSFDEGASEVFIDAFTVAADSTNHAPVVNAGLDQTISLPNSVNLNGTATDDGFPSGSTLSVQWTKVSGAGSVNFANAAQAATSASFTAAGVYVLRLRQPMAH